MKILIKGDLEKESKREKRERFVKKGKQNHIYIRSSLGRINEEMTMNNGGTTQIARQKLTCMFWMGQKS